MDAIERAVPAPQIEIIVQGRAWRQVFRNRAPLAARAQDVHQTVSNLAQVHRALITTRLGRREAWLDQRPLRIGQVAWIAQVVAVIAGTIFGRPHRQRLPQNQAATLESQPIHPIQYLPGQTLRLSNRNLTGKHGGRADLGRWLVTWLPVMSLTPCCNWRGSAQPGRTVSKRWRRQSITAR